MLTRNDVFILKGDDVGMLVVPALHVVLDRHRQPISAKAFMAKAPAAATGWLTTGPARTDRAGARANPSRLSLFLNVQDPLRRQVCPVAGVLPPRFHTSRHPLQLVAQPAISRNRPLTQSVRRLRPVGGRFPGIQLGNAPHPQLAPKPLSCTAPGPPNGPSQHHRGEGTEVSGDCPGPLHQ